MEAEITILNGFDLKFGILLTSLHSFVASNTSIAYNSTIVKTLIPNKRCSTTGCCTAKILPSSKDFYALHLSRQPPQTISTFQISHTNTGFGDQSLRWKPTNLRWDATKDIKNIFFSSYFLTLQSDISCLGLKCMLADIVSHTVNSVLNAWTRYLA